MRHHKIKIELETMLEQMIKSKLEELSEDLKKEALDYIEFLLQKHKRKVEEGKFRFDWEGGLSELKEHYSSVELQHKAMKWR